MNGSCACRAIEYEIDTLDSPIGHCHCITCRKTHASAYTSTAGVNREHFRWVKGQELLSSFESSPRKLRHFCSRCGSHIVAERLNQPQLILRVATLDDDPKSRPTMHIWRSHDVPWLSDDQLPSYQEWQPGR